MFGSVDKNTGKIAPTQHQILEFCRKRPDLLGPVTLFPFKSKGKFFVACVCRGDDGAFFAIAYRFGYEIVWYAGYGVRGVVLQLDR